MTDASQTENGNGGSGWPAPSQRARNWRRRYRPLNSQVLLSRQQTPAFRTRSNSQSLGTNAAAGATGPSFLKRTRSGALIQIVKRSLSAPSVHSLPSRIVPHRPNTPEQRGVAVSSPLDPIPEETSRAGSSVESSGDHGHHLRV